MGGGSASDDLLSSLALWTRCQMYKMYISYTEIKICEYYTGMNILLHRMHNIMIPISQHTLQKYRDIKQLLVVIYTVQLIGMTQVMDICL